MIATGPGQPVEATLQKIRQALIELQLVSHAPIATLDRSPRDSTTSAGGNRPSGGSAEYLPSDSTTDERLSWESSYLSKTVDFYQRRLEGSGDRPGLLADPRLSEDQRAIRLGELLADIEATLRGWRFTPAPQSSGLEPERGTFYWKCMVADDDRGSLKQIHQRHQVSRMTLWRYRQRYRGILGQRSATG